MSYWNVFYKTDKRKRLADGVFTLVAYSVADAFEKAVFYGLSRSQIVHALKV